MYILEHRDNSIFISNTQYQKGDFAAVNYDYNKGIVKIIPKYSGRSYEGHFSDFGDSDGYAFETMSDLRTYITDHFFFELSGDDPPAPVTPNLQSVTVAGNLTQAGITIDRFSDYAGRMLYKDRSSRDPGFSAGTMSVIKYPTAKAIFANSVTGCVFIRLSTGITEVAGNVMIKGRFLGKHENTWKVVNFEINGYLRENNIIYVDDRSFFADKPVRWMADANGFLNLVIGDNASTWSFMRCQVIDVVTRNTEDYITVSCGFADNVAGFTQYSPVTRVYRNDYGFGAYDAHVFSAVNAIVTPVKGLYTRIGNVVSAEILLNVETTDTANSVSFDLDLPVPSDFTIDTDCLGIAAGNGTTSSRIRANTADNRISVTLNNPTTGIWELPITLKYIVK